MVWIPYGDSGSLTSRFDSSDDSYGSIILLSAQTTVGVLVGGIDSSDHTISSSSLHASTTPILVIDSDAIVYPTHIISGANVYGNVDSAVAVSSAPTQVWIG